MHVRMGATCTICTCDHMHVHMHNTCANAHQQAQQGSVHGHEASSDEGDAMSDDETTSSKDAYDQGEF